MKPSHGVAALLGAGVTILVYQTLVLPRAAATDARAHGLAATAQPAPPEARPAPSAREQSQKNVAVLQMISSKEKEIARLQEDLQHLRNEGEAAAQKIEQLEGIPQKWPEQIPAGFKRDALEANLRQTLAKNDLGELLEVRCEEYPCVAVIRAKQSDDDWQQRLQTSLRDMSQSPEYGSGINMSMWSSEQQKGDKKTQMTAVSLTPPDQFDDDARNRTGHRARTALTDSTDHE